MTRVYKEYQQTSLPQQQPTPKDPSRTEHRTLTLRASWFAWLHTIRSDMAGSHIAREWSRRDRQGYMNEWDGEARKSKLQVQ